MPYDVLDELAAMSNRLAEPALDYVILGEGNTSARADADTFWVKASGHEMRSIAASGFVRVAFDRVLAMLGADPPSDEQVKRRLTTAKVDPTQAGHPSVETLLHAVCLSLEGIQFVGHTHPTPILALTCSVAFETAFRGRLFPDEIVVCGPAPLLVPYTDPGIPLAQKIGQLLAAYQEQHQQAPRAVLMQNHGLIALGRTAGEVESITAMMVKTARALLGTFAAGGPAYMSQAAVDRIHSRPDEALRRRQLGLA